MVPIVADKTHDRKEQIIKTAMQLFAVKGSSSTSMQEIAELCGISKGSLYLVFKSKEELENSIYIYCFRMIREPLEREEQAIRRSPREKLRNQIEILLVHVYELREFLQRQIQDYLGQGVTQAPDWLRKSNGPLLGLFRSKLEEIYGKEALAYTGDVGLLAWGMLHASVMALFQQETPISIPRLADYLMDMLDIVVSGLTARRPEPLFSAVMMESWLLNHESNAQQSPLQLIKAMKTLLGTAEAEPDHDEEALESLDVMENEMLMPHPRKAIIKGMLLNLREVPLLQKELAELERLISPYLQQACYFR
ncbi:TetR/AcrR family transcriptional regulator ['Paenibacillus yunnanensis' Narsing Rao et al. 2020]|uniref:TetR/AcrR family transcriptional regulator n=1 Tax=Paenibacillus tengchongensis TaxID=2608684 RepID=UPI00124E2E9C|nr:TetR/AcrR family transcriptional regulator [Paenibacillus tengchongensis]